MSPALEKPETVGADVGPWKPWLALADVPPLDTRADLKPSLFLGSKYSIGDAREIFQGNAHRNELVAIAINGDVARRIARAANNHDDLLAALKIAAGHIEHMAAFFGGKGLGYSFESLGEDMPGIRTAITKATGGE